MANLLRPRQRWDRSGFECGAPTGVAVMRPNPRERAPHRAVRHSAAVPAQEL
jgi:hypothetical protein